MSMKNILKLVGGLGLLGGSAYIFSKVSDYLKKNISAEKRYTKEDMLKIAGATIGLGTVVASWGAVGSDLKKEIKEKV